MAGRDGRATSLVSELVVENPGSRYDLFLRCYWFSFFLGHCGGDTCWRAPPGLGLDEPSWPRGINMSGLWTKRLGLGSLLILVLHLYYYFIYLFIFYLWCGL